MKNTRHIIFTTLLLLVLNFCAVTTRAQRLVFIYGHLQYEAPLAQRFNDAYNFGVGGEAGVGVGLFGKTFVTGTLGYSVFKSAGDNNTGNLKYTPITFGLRHYLFMRLLYIDANAGVAVVKNKAVDATSRFTGNAGAGVKLGAFDLAVDYNCFRQKDPSGWATWMDFKAGWNFGL